MFCNDIATALTNTSGTQSANWLVQSFNRYTYVLNNPLRYTDPTGYDTFGGFGDFFDTVLDFLQPGGGGGSAQPFVLTTGQVQTGSGGFVTFGLEMNDQSNPFGTFNNGGFNLNLNNSGFTFKSGNDQSSGGGIFSTISDIYTFVDTPLITVSAPSLYSLVVKREIEFAPYSVSALDVGTTLAGGKIVQVAGRVAAGTGVFRALSGFLGRSVDFLTEKSLEATSFVTRQLGFGGAKTVINAAQIEAEAIIDSQPSFVFRGVETDMQTVFKEGFRPC